MRNYINIVENGVPPDLGELIEQFAEKHPEYSTQEGATDKCYEASVQFLDFAKSRGFTDIFMDETAVVNHTVHRVANVNGVIIDWTARQFNPNAPFPLVLPQNTNQQEINELLGLNPLSEGTNDKSHPDFENDVLSEATSDVNSVVKKWRQMEKDNHWPFERLNRYDIACMIVADDDDLFGSICFYVSNFESGIAEDAVQLTKFVTILRSLPKRPIRNIWRGECRSSWREKFGRGFHSWSLSLEIAKEFASQCWHLGRGKILHINKSVRHMELSDIATWRMRLRQGESHYGSIQAEVFVLDEDALRVANEIDLSRAEIISQKPIAYRPRRTQ